MPTARHRRQPLIPEACCAPVIRPPAGAQSIRIAAPHARHDRWQLWVPAVLASTIAGSPNYDPVNAALLGQGALMLTLDLDYGWDRTQSRCWTARGMREENCRCRGH